MKKILLTLLTILLTIGILIAVGYTNATTTDVVERIITFYTAVSCTALIILGAAFIIILGD